MRPIVALLGLVTAMLVGVAAPLGAIVTAGLLSRQPLSAAGAEVNDHLTGLDQYIRLAEADRMRVLQSPQGALREPIDPNDRGARPFTVGAFAAGVGSVSSTLSSSYSGTSSSGGSGGGGSSGGGGGGGGGGGV